MKNSFIFLNIMLIFEIMYNTYSFLTYFIIAFHNKYRVSKETLKIFTFITNYFYKI